MTGLSPLRYDLYMNHRVAPVALRLAGLFLRTPENFPAKTQRTRTEKHKYLHTAPALTGPLALSLSLSLLPSLGNLELECNVSRSSKEGSLSASPLGVSLLGRTIGVKRVFFLC